jgi:hypothetical protein
MLVIKQLKAALSVCRLDHEISDSFFGSQPRITVNILRPMQRCACWPFFIYQVFVATKLRAASDKFN